jgi:sodium/proline symporter
MEVYEKLADPLALAIFVLTLALPVLVGLVAMRRTRDQSDFFVGGRAMGKFVVALSAVSTGRSSWLVLGLCGIAYTRGTGAVWAVVGYVVVEMFQFIYLGRRLRKQTERHGSITLLDYLESRFQDRQQVLRITGAAIIAIFITAYVAAQLKAGADSLGTALGIDPLLALGLSVVLILVYMVLGGYVAVAFNDAIRAALMLFGLVILPVVALAQLGGFSGMLEVLGALDPALVDPFSVGAGVLIGFVGIGLGSPGQPHILVRYMSINNPDQLRLTAVIGTSWNVVLAWGALFVGLLCRVMVPDVAEMPLKANGQPNPEMAYLVLSSAYFGPVLYGLLVGGIFAAILSTADSQLLVVASTFVRDVYEKVIARGQEIGERRKLRLSRVVVVLSGLFAMVLAYLAEDLIFWLVLFAWGGLGASFGPAVILSLYWRGVTRWGVLAGMLTGTLTVVVWKLWLKKPTGLYELIPAFVLSMLVIAAVSLVTRREK